MSAETDPATTDPDSATATSSAPRCWCCDGEFDEESLVHLGARPEVAICLDCARFLDRRALARRNEQRWTPMGAVRGCVERVRNWVIENGWHQRGPLGAFLRRLDRYLP